MANAQLIIQIEELSLSYYNVNFDENVIDGDLENGPFVYFKCSIINNSDTCIVLNPSKSKSNFTFRYKKVNYYEEVFPLAFVDLKKLDLFPRDTIDLCFGSFLLLGTDIYKCKKSDYTKEMLAIMPTLQIVYQDKKIKIHTNGVNNVVIKE
ncbi:MAG: hypothetical protein ACEPOV_14795 [Hyphomicrobiales bacterium]